MPTFAERLNACIEERHTTAARVARSAGISGASMSDWTTNKTHASNLKAEPLLRAAAFLEVNPMWLLTGRGSKHPGSAPVALAAEQTAFYGAWPFEVLDYATVRQLKPNELSRLEGAWLLVAKQLGFSLEKPAAA
jgi:transcriptional regulator with XRE-family HTH domain